MKSKLLESCSCDNHVGVFEITGVVHNFALDGSLGSEFIVEGVLRLNTDQREVMILVSFYKLQATFLVLTLSRTNSFVNVYLAQF